MLVSVPRPAGSDSLSGAAFASMYVTCFSKSALIMLTYIRNQGPEIQSYRLSSQISSHDHGASARGTALSGKEFTTSEVWKPLEHSLISHATLNLPLQPLASEVAVPTVVEELPFTGKDYKPELQPTCEDSTWCDLASTKIADSSSNLSRLVSHWTSLSEGDTNNEFTVHDSPSSTHKQPVETERIRHSSEVATKNIEPLTNFVLSGSGLHQLDMTGSIGLPLFVSGPQTHPIAPVPEIIQSANTSSTEECKGPLISQPLATEYERPFPSGPRTQDLKHDISAGRLIHSDIPSQTRSMNKAPLDFLSVSSSITQTISATTQSQLTTTGFDQYSQTTKYSPGLPKEDWTMKNTQASMVMSAHGWKLILGTVSGASLAFACIFYLQRVCYARARKHENTVLLDHIPNDKAYNSEPMQRGLTQTLEVSRFSEDS